MSAVLRKLCVLCRFTGCRFWPLYSKLGMHTFSTCSIWCTRCGVWLSVQRYRTLRSKFFRIHAKHDNKWRVFSELSADLFLAGSGENEYRRLPEMAYATSELMVVVVISAGKRNSETKIAIESSGVFHILTRLRPLVIVKDADIL